MRLQDVWRREVARVELKRFCETKPISGPEPVAYRGRGTQDFGQQDAGGTAESLPRAKKPAGGKCKTKPIPRTNNGRKPCRTLEFRRSCETKPIGWLTPAGGRQAIALQSDDSAKRSQFPGLSRWPIAGEEPRTSASRMLAVRGKPPAGEEARGRKMRNEANSEDEQRAETLPHVEFRRSCETKPIGWLTQQAEGRPLR